MVLVSENTEAVVSRLGSMVMEWKVGKKDVLYLLQMVDGKLRGGNFFVFPIAGPPTKEGEFPNLPQHGFARDKKWTGWVSPGGNEAFLDLHADSETREVYPHNFSLAAHITLEEGVLKYELGIGNKNPKEEMPFVFGLHPYFQLPSLDVLPRIETNLPDFKPEIEALKKSLISDCPEEDIKIKIPEWGEVTMIPSKEFKKLVVWTDGRGPYLCFEPWTSGPFTIDKKEERTVIPPEGTLKLAFEMQFQPA